MDSIRRSDGRRPTQRKHQSQDHTQHHHHHHQQLQPPQASPSPLPPSPSPRHGRFEAAHTIPEPPSTNNAIRLPPINIPHSSHYDNNDVIEISSGDDMEVTEVSHPARRVVDLDNDSFIQDPSQQHRDGENEQQENDDEDDDDIEITGSNNNPVPLTIPLPIISSVRRRDSPRPTSSLDNDGVEEDDEIEITNIRPLSSISPPNINTVSNYTTNDLEDFGIISLFGDFMHDISTRSENSPAAYQNQFQSPPPSVPFPNHTPHTPNYLSRQNSVNVIHNGNNHQRVRISNGDQVIPETRIVPRIGNHDTYNNSINNNSRVSFATNDVIIDQNPDLATPPPPPPPTLPRRGFPATLSNILERARHRRGNSSQRQVRFVNQALGLNQRGDRIRPPHWTLPENNFIGEDGRHYYLLGAANFFDMDEDAENSIMRRIERDNENELDNRIAHERNYNKRILDDKKKSAMDEKSGYVNDIKTASNLCCEVCAITLGEGIPADFKPDKRYNENFQKYVQQYRVNAPWFCITQCSKVDIELSKRVFAAKCGHVYCGRCVKNIGNRPRKSKTTPTGYTITNPQVYAPHSCAANDCKKRLSPKSFTELYY